MRTIAIAVLCCFRACFLVLAAGEDKYLQAMQEALSQLHAAASPQEMQAVASRFEMIGRTASKEWLPDYYAAYCYARLSYMVDKESERDRYVEQAEKLLAKHQEQQDELYLMRAFVAQANLAVNGAARWMKQGGIFNENLGMAEKLNPNNPRVHYLRGSNLFHTPAMFGGGKKAALPHLQKAKELFEKEQPASPIAPSWGKVINLELLKQCQKDK
jgi:hypothetical protein